MSDLMRQDEFDGQLRRFLAWQAEDVATAPTATEIAARINARVHGRIAGQRLTPQVSWIVVVGLLAALLAAAVLVGALLLNLDKLFSVLIPPSPTQTATPTAVVGTLSAEDEPFEGQCGPAATDELAVRFSVGTVEPTEESRLVLVLSDGTVLKGLRSEVRFGAGLATRRLSGAGLEKVSNLVFDANLPNCQPITTGAPSDSGFLQAHSTGRDVTTWFGPPRGIGVRRNAATEVVAMTAVAGQLRDLDAALDASDWRDDNWQPFLPEMWRLKVTLLPDNPEHCGLDAAPTTGPAPSFCLHWATGVQLADGTPLLSFGTLYPGHRSPTGGYEASYRCGLIDSQVASGVPDALGMYASSGRPYEREWDHPRYGGTLMASLTGLLPGDDECDRPPAPPEPGGEPPSDPAPAVDACALISGTLDVHNHLIGPLDAGWWTGCVAEVDPGDIHIQARGRLTSAADGESYALSLFGENVDSESIAGRTLYWNDCFDGTGECTPGLAVVSEPNLVVVSWLAQSRAGFKSWLQRAIMLNLMP